MVNFDVRAPGSFHQPPRKNGIVPFNSGKPCDCQSAPAVISSSLSVHGGVLFRSGLRIQPFWKPPFFPPLPAPAAAALPLLFLDFPRRSYIFQTEPSMSHFIPILQSFLSSCTMYAVAFQARAFSPVTTSRIILRFSPWNRILQHLAFV